jgi:hypothetical protein
MRSLADTGSPLHERGSDREHGKCREQHDRGRGVPPSTRHTDALGRFELEDGHQNSWGRTKRSLKILNEHLSPDTLLPFGTDTSSHRRHVLRGGVWHIDKVIHGARV